MNGFMQSGFDTAARFAPEPQPHDPRGRAILGLAEAIARANEAIRDAVEAGVSVELVRTCRHHDGCGNWGDQIEPCFRRAPTMQ